MVPIVETGTIQRGGSKKLSQNDRNDFRNGTHAGHQHTAFTAGRLLFRPHCTTMESPQPTTEDSMGADEIPPPIEGMLHQLADGLAREKVAALANMLAAQQSALFILLRLSLETGAVQRERALEEFHRTKSETGPEMTETHALLDQFLRILRPPSLQ